MATIASISVDFVARTDKFSRSVKKSEKEISRFSKTTRTSLKSAATAWKGFAAAIVGSVVVRELQRTVQEIDKLAKTSAKLGIATENLQGLQFAAKLTGVETNTLNMGLQRMIRRVSEAAQGTGEAQGALKELGLDAKRLSALSPERQFAAIADAMAGVASEGDKVRLLFKIFDSEGVGLKNTLDLQSKGLRQAQKDFENLGGAIRDSDAKKIEEFNNALTKLGVTFQGFKKDVVVFIAPAATRTVNALEGVRRTLNTSGTKSRNAVLKDPRRDLGDFIGSFFTENPNLRKAQTLTDEQARRFAPGGEVEFGSIANAERERIKRREANIKIERRLEQESRVNRHGFENRERSRQALERGLAQVPMVFNKLFLAQANLLRVGGNNIARGSTGLVSGISERTSGQQGEAPINRAVLADSREGFMALRRHQGPIMKENQKQTVQLRRQTTILEQIKNAISPETLGLF